jgi:hypothetical protein
MKSWQRYLYFLLLNVVVSALTTWLVVTLLLKDYPQANLPEPAEVADAVSGGGEEGQPDPTQAPGTDGLVVPGQLEISTIIGAGDIENERIMILHIGEEETSMAGWQIMDEDGHVFIFPVLTIFKGGGVTVYTKAGVNTAAELYWGLSEAVWEVGERVVLIDPNGNIQAVYTIP